MNPSDFSTYRALLLNEPPSPDVILPGGETTRLLQRGVLVSLAEDAGSEALSLLAETAASSPLEDIRVLALQILIILADRHISAADQELCRLVLLHGLETAREIAVKNGFFPAEPEEEAAFRLLTAQEYTSSFDSLAARYTLTAKHDVQERLLSAARANGWVEWAAIVSARIQSPAGLETLWLSLKQDSSHDLVRTILAADAQNGDSSACEALCQIYLKYADEISAATAQQFQILPADPGERAAFLFLSGQFVAYQALDFNHDLLTSYYQVASREVKKRILAQTRKAGQSAWLESLTAERQIRWLAELNDADWESSLKILKLHQRWDDLWRLAQAAPSWWSVQIFNILRDQAWQPSIEPSGFHHLSDLSSRCEHAALTIQQTAPTHTLPGEITTLVPHPSTDQYASADATGLIHEWDAATGKMTVRLESPPGPVWSLVYSPDGKYLVSGHSDQTIRVWRMEDRRIVKTLEGHRALVKALSIHPDGTLLASAGFDQTVRLWRFPYGPEIKTLGSNLGEIFTLAIGSDGQWVAAGGASGEIQMWSLPDGSAHRSLPGHTGIVTALEINAVHHFLTSASRDHKVRIWNYPLGNPLKTLSGHDSPVTSLALHPDGQWAASGSVDGTLSLWRISASQPVQHLTLDSSPITSLAFS
ncbi:MAG: WD40 repeat domain-containing protein, partial [Anaerolineaceae bacterium]